MAESRGMLRVVSPDALAQADQQAIADRQTQEDEAVNEVRDSDLRNYVQGRWEIMRNHRSTYGLDNRLLAAMRIFNGEYDPGQLAEIQKFGGSEVYARVVGTKARGATALLRDVYFNNERPWSLRPTPNPTMPDDIAGSIANMVNMEAQAMTAAGQPPDPTMIDARAKQLTAAAKTAARDQSVAEAEKAELALEDILIEGEFYGALAEFLVDLPLFPFGCIKGPVVKMSSEVTWQQGQAVITDKPKMFWERVSPFDVYFLPGVSSIKRSDIIHRLRWTRQDLNDLIGLPGWDEEAIRNAVREYDQGLRDWLDPIDSSRSRVEGREDPGTNRSNMIDAVNFHGAVQGKMLHEIGFTQAEVPDEDRDYLIECWIVGRFILKTQLSPSPRRRHPFYITSFEKVPGTPIGNALPDILADIEEVANASLRSLVNNMALASGPQVVIMSNRFAATEDIDSMYPWKRWHAADEPGQMSLPPVQFYQPQSNASELLGIYQKMTEISDEISAIPRYITGSGAPGGAGRTASGLSMLMGNASKQLQQVASNVDIDVLDETLQSLYDMVMLTGAPGLELKGDENIDVRGAATVMAKEAERTRQLEFLQLTANPIDMQILGIEGRAEVLRHVANDLGLMGTPVVPTREQMLERQQQALAAQQAAAQAGAPPGQAGGGGGPGQPGQPSAPSPEGDAPRQNTVQMGHNAGTASGGTGGPG
jgi:hypothetical protein